MEFSIFKETSRWAAAKELNVWAQDSTSSTNDEAKNNAFKTEPFKLFITDEQTSGRGRGDHTWSNPSKGTSLLSSWSFSLNQSPTDITSLVFGLALFKSLKELFPQLDFKVKEPNDLFLEDLKIAGILAETISQGDKFQLVVGLGLNIFSHPSDVEQAGHLSSKADLTIEKWHLFLDSLYSNFTEASTKCQSPQLSDQQSHELEEAKWH